MLNDLEMLRTKWNPTINRIVKEYQGVMVAHSGGADSTALFHVLYQWSKQNKNLNLSIYHMNFGLRGKESDLDQSFSRDFAKRFGVPFFTDSVSPEERELRSGESLQEWARRLRYRAFKTWTNQGWVIALGHHQDDLAENALLRLSRGSSVGNLGGMTAWNPPFWRPLLSTKKSDIDEYLGKNSLSHRHDATNDKIEYSRNFIRHAILGKLNDLYPGTSERIARTANEASALQEWCELEVTKALDLQGSPNGPYLRSLPPEIGKLAISELVKRDGVHRQLSRKFLDDVWTQLNLLNEGQWVRDLPSSGQIVIQGDHLEVGKTPKIAASPSYRQHGASHSPIEWEMTLQPHSHVILNEKGTIWRVESFKSAPIQIRCRNIRPSEVLRFEDDSGAYKQGYNAKKLLQSWDIPAEKRHNVLIVELDGALAGVYCKNEIRAPDQKKVWRQIEDIAIRVEET